MAQQWELQQWAIPRLGQLLPLTEPELAQIVTHTIALPDDAAEKELHDLLGDSDEAVKFRAEFIGRRTQSGEDPGETLMDMKGMDERAKADTKTQNGPSDAKPSLSEKRDLEKGGKVNGGTPDAKAIVYAPPTAPPPSYGSTKAVATRHHTNAVIEAAKVRARDEQEMQQILQNLQYRYRIYNSDIEPEHDTDYYCNCAVCDYKRAKWRRYPVQKMWSEAVMYPGEKAYNDNTMNGASIFTRNPYQFRVNSPFGYNAFTRWSVPKPIPSWHARMIHQTIDLNNSLNKEAQANVDAREPRHSIWDDDAMESAMSNLAVGDRKQSVASSKDNKAPLPTPKASDEKRLSLVPSTAESAQSRGKPSRFSSFRKSLGIKSTDERTVSKVQKAVVKGSSLRDDIEAEERARWPDHQWRMLVDSYQEKVGMARMIADLRARKPIQYLHLLRAGYFEPIPVAWANQASNPLKFSIEAAAGWRGITPAWRGYEDTAEERLYWVLNHREGSVGMRMKPDFISELNMARERMARAVEPPPVYWSDTDTCHLQHTSAGYSKQVMPPPYQAYDRPEVATDDTMILLDVSGSMDFDPQRPLYDQYTVTGFAPSTQPKNKDVAKSIIRRFADAMANHDHQNAGYDLTTFSSQASYIGTINHGNLDQKWRNVRFGGGTRVMTGWQKVKDLHFQKHSESATHHPIYGWQAGPETPMLRLLLLLDGEATDMDEFELDLLGLSWAHVTIFLIGVDGCPHHHRHANELQRISDVNHHVSFVDAQGNTPERFVTHELLKRHLGYDISMREFEEMEELPAYEE